MQIYFAPSGGKLMQKNRKKYQTPVLQKQNCRLYWHKNRRYFFMRLRFTVFLFLFLVPLFLEALECNVCKKEITGRYCAVNGKTFCSEKCYESTLPACSHCGKRCRQRYRTPDGKIFCSQECLRPHLPVCSVCKTPLKFIVTVKNSQGEQKIFCKKCSTAKTCYYCALPAGDNKLSDGRHICRQCRSQAVTDHREIRKLFRQVREELVREHGFDKKHRIELLIVDHPAIIRAAEGMIDDGNNDRRLGLMRYQEKKEKRLYSDGKTKERLIGTDCRIYVLHTMPRDVLCQTFAHELTHDHLRHNVGTVKDIVAEEGFCELVAYLYNKRHKLEYLNLAKEANPSPVYGDGFRKMLKIYKRSRSLERTMKYVR